MRNLLVAALLALASRATTTATPMEEVKPQPLDPHPAKSPQPAQVFVSKMEPPIECKQVGAVDSSYPLGSYEDKLATLREQAAEKGGNYLVVDSPSMGRAYFCPPPCRPACSPGFVCIQSACVSACNPACKSGERCEGDRLCHPLAPVGTES
jgi:hypothetical protein